MSGTEALAAVQRRSYASAGAGITSSWPERDALDAQGMADLFERTRYGVLATARRDGRAHAAPVAFLLAGGSFWIGTVEGLRLRNLRATPWASLVVMENGSGASPHVALTAEGSVRIHEGDGFARALAPIRGAWKARHGSAPAWAVALLELRSERVFSYASAAGGGR